MLGKIKKIFELQGKISQIKKELEDTKIETSRDNGNIKVIMSANQKLLSLDIADSLIVAQDKEGLKRDLLNCINEAIEKTQQIATQKAKEITGLNIPGL